MEEPSQRPLIDVIVPVHGAGPVFKRCAASLASHLDPIRHRLIVVIDGIEDADITAALTDLSARGLDLRIERHASPHGFVVSANRGLRVSDRDVVLLNSDTQVTPGWLDALFDAAWSAASIATVTPFSNNATICSLPRFLAENTVPSGYDLETFAALVSRASRREYPRLPTGVGACLFIKRRVIQDIGVLDETFGLGYGEEIDFCLRATARGYEHVLDDATYIFHEGSRSFGRRRPARVRRAHRILRTRYPAYWRTLADFIARDPVAPARARVIAAMRSAAAPPAVTAPPTAAAPPLASAPPPAAAPAVLAPRPRRRIVHLVHGWPPWAYGGTELYVYRLAMQQRDAHDVAVYARIADADRDLGDAIEHDDRGVRVRLVVNNFTQRDPLCRSGFHCRRIAADFRAFLADVRPDLLHAHHLAGHCASLMTVARQRALPIVYQLQDWWPLCARANLVDRQGALCSGPAPAKCARCLPITGLPGATLANPLLYAARRRWMRRQLAHASAFVTGSHFTSMSYERSGILPPSVPRHVLTYGVHEDADAAADRIADRDARAVADGDARAAAAPLRFGYIGALLPHKGVHIAIDAFASIDPEQAQLHVWGFGENAEYRRRLEAATQPPRLTYHGAFPESAKREILRSLDVLIVPSIGYESFGIVAREAMAHGVPVLASRLGALTELFDAARDGDEADARDEGGALFEPGDSTSLARWIRRAIDEPDLLRRWRAALPRVKTVACHADEIERIYSNVLAERPPGRSSKRQSR